jgi:hypothetical protein
VKRIREIAVRAHGDNLIARDIAHVHPLGIFPFRDSWNDDVAIRHHPAKRSPSRIGSEPMSSLSINPAASDNDVSAVTHHGLSVITSWTLAPIMVPPWVGFHFVLYPARLEQTD